MVRDNREAETEMERRRRRRKAEKLRGLKRRRRRLVLAILAVLFLPIIGARIYFGVNPVILKNSVIDVESVSYTHLRAHETDSYLVCRLLLEKKKKKQKLKKTKKTKRKKEKAKK